MKVSSAFDDEGVVPIQVTVDEPKARHDEALEEFYERLRAKRSS